MKSEIQPAKQPLSYRQLMQNRIHEILVVSSVYDAFKLQEDGHLSEMLISQFQSYNLISTPRITRVSTAAHAFIKLESMHYDLIITMAHIVDMNPYDFGTKVKEKFDDIPIIMLTANKAEHNWLLKSSKNLDSIDRIFYWYGDSSIFPAIIKYIEDKQNAERDILKGMVRTLIIVEDSPEFYSIFLPLFYKIIIQSVDQLIVKEYTEDRKLFRMYSRPKILLTSSYEEAISYYDKYKKQVLAVISDVRYLRKGNLDGSAGVELIKTILDDMPSMPVLLFSMEQNNEKIADDIGAYFLDKNSDNLVQELKRFILSHCGFGDLIFTTKEKEYITKAKNLQSLEEALRTVPTESIEYHAKRNHFSNWLAVRGYFQLADYLKLFSYKDFEEHTKDLDLREFLIEGISNQRNILLTDKVIIYNRETYDPAFKYVRMGNGSIGGKARGLVFLVNFMKQFEFETNYPDIKVDIPNFVVLTTDIYDTFMEQNNILSKLKNCKSDPEINNLFLSCSFDSDFYEDLVAYLEKNKTPLAIRSSSLLEDNYFEPFAGIYKTLMVANCSTDFGIRIKQLEDAIKLVYASTWHENARAYMKSTGHRSEDEKMAVVIQQLIGKKHENRFYPTFSGVIQSYNYYPQQKLQREDGLTTIALGLGRTVVGGEKALRFSPKYPKIVPQFFDTESIFKSSQNKFWILKSENCDTMEPLFDEESNLEHLDLHAAEDDGELQIVGSVYNAVSDTFKENFYDKGTRAVTFANILKWKIFPLSSILKDITQIMKSGMGSEVEMEFAANIYMDGKRRSEFYILQIRPQITYGSLRFVKDEELNKESLLVRSDICLGNGIFENIRDILYISKDDFNILETKEIVEEIRELNEQFSNERPYLLLAPGRWGTADPMLGIPVAWIEISNAKCIVEVGLPDLYIEPSFGSHFFQNMTSLNISYFTIPPDKVHDNLNWDWMDKQEPVTKTKHLRHLHFDEDLFIQVEGMSGKGLVLKPGFQKEEDEDDYPS